MNCTTCKSGTLENGLTTVTLTKGESVIVFKHVPALVCSTCSDFVLSEATSRHLLSLSEEEQKRGAEMLLINYKRAA